MYSEATMFTFDEAAYENSLIELFRNMGYQYEYGPNVERDVRSPLYEDVLVDSLHRLNPNLPENAFADALYRLKNYENGELVQKNAVFMDYLQNGIPVRFWDKGEEKSSANWQVGIKNSVLYFFNQLPLYTYKNAFVKYIVGVINLIVTSTCFNT